MVNVIALAQVYHLGQVGVVIEPFLNGSKANPLNSLIHLHYEGNWVCLFFDGAVAGDFENAFVGGVVHDRAENWILGFNHYIGRCTPFEAEL